jgi:hypothetical protein
VEGRIGLLSEARGYITGYIFRKRNSITQNPRWILRIAG